MKAQTTVAVLILFGLTALPVYADVTESIRDQGRAALDRITVEIRDSMVHGLPAPVKADDGSYPVGEAIREQDRRALQRTIWELEAGPPARSESL